VLIPTHALTFAASLAKRKRGNEFAIKKKVEHIVEAVFSALAARNMESVLLRDHVNTDIFTVRGDAVVVSGLLVSSLSLYCCLSRSPAMFTLSLLSPLSLSSLPLLFPFSSSLCNHSSSYPSPPLLQSPAQGLGIWHSRDGGHVFGNLHLFPLEQHTC
jgi:hypothetical protein